MGTDDLEFAPGLKQPLQGDAGTAATEQLPALSRSWPAVAESVAEARRALVRFAEAAGANREQLDAVRLATSEALTNVVMHAYRGRTGLIHVGAALASRELWILIADDGGGLRPREDSPGLGHGLRLIADATDALTILNRAGGGTELRLRFDLDHQPAEDQLNRADR